MYRTLKKNGYVLPQTDEITFIKADMKLESGASGYTHGTEIYLNGRAGVKDRTKAEIGVDEKMKTYFPTNYLPQIIGVTIGKILGLGTVPMLYLARILTIIAYIAGCLHAVRTAPVGKVIFASTALLPSALMAGCSITYDAMVLISTLCFTASILRARHEPENRAALIESAVWAAVIGSVKGGGYLILLALYRRFFKIGQKGGSHSGCRSFVRADL